MLADAELYSHYHRMQERDANMLLDCVLPKMSFGEEDVIMDIGCGSGDNTKNILLPRIPKMKKLVAIDVIPRMIEFARTHNMADDKIEYHVADIEDKSSLKPWEGCISKVFSVHCFHWLKDQRRGFEALYSVLKSEGEAALLFALSCETWNSYPTVINNVKWNKYLKDANPCIPDSHYLNLRAEFFRDVFEDLGFEVLLCQEEERTHTYRKDSECRASVSSRSSLTSYIPEELREEFIDDLFEAHVKFNPRNSEGLPMTYITVLTVHLRKP